MIEGTSTCCSSCKDERLGHAIGSHYCRDGCDTAVTAVEDDVTSSAAASCDLTPTASQAQKPKRPTVSPGGPGPYFVRRVTTPFSDYTDREYPKSPGLLNIRFGRPQLIGLIQRLGKCADPIAVMAAL